MRLLAFFKREVVLTVAALCALATMVLVPPDAAYLGYIDLRVLCLLLCLMAVVAGFQSCGAFRWLAGHLLSRGTGPRALAVILVLLPFFCSMAVTNDVALITFAPFALLLLDQMDCRAAAVPLLVLQTIAANLGSMATPVGNPQNLYLYGAYGLSAGDFFPVVLPLAGISLACLTATALPVLPRDLQIPPVHPQPLRQPGKLALYGALFLLCLLTVFRILPYGLLTVLVLGTLAAVEPALLRKLDVSLLCTFICFFVVSGNLGRLPAPSWFSFCRNRSTSRPVRESRAPVGSSARITDGFPARARAMETRCCWPPESWLGRFFRLSARPTRSRDWMARSRRSSAETPAYSSGSSTFSCTVSLGIRLYCWKIKPSILLRISACWSSSMVDTSTPPRW